MAKNFSRAFTLIELLVVIVVIAVLATIAYPVYTGVIERARVTQDMNNVRQVGLGIQTYLNDNDQVLPATTTWPGTTAAPVLYPKYIATRKVFQSPFDKRTPSESDAAPPVPISYSINANMYAVAPGINRNMTSVVSPASTILMAPNYPSPPGNPTNLLSWPGIATNAPNLPVGGTGETRGTHSNGTRINALFCDFHTESLTFSLTGPPYPAGTFQDTTSNPLGLKHWDPTQ
jgi:prepilin-type N-terminal cleavage/methylation domain-containing protein/prepilin-type processing-associated H-X9-DG protein